jgi:tRNA 2-thiouridine synthesizing protein A
MPVLEIIQRIDARGLSCPMPIVKTAQAMRLLEPGSAIELLATDAGSVKDVAAWCRTTGNILVEQTSDGGVHRFVIQRK